MACKSIITHIEAQIDRVLSQYDQLESDYNAVCQERNELQAQVREQQETIQALNAELKKLRLADGLAGNANDKNKSRARINQLLREVDKCITLLTKAQQD